MPEPSNTELASTAIPRAGKGDRSSIRQPDKAGLLRYLYFTG